MTATDLNEILMIYYMITITENNCVRDANI